MKLSLTAFILASLIGSAYAQNGCEGSALEKDQQTESIFQEISTEAPFMKVGNFKSASALTKDGIRYVYSYTITQRGTEYSLAGTALFGGATCTLLERLNSVVK